MKINIHNYEAFFLDFVEGKLDDASTLEMLAFLRKHPDLKAELENFTDVRIESSEILFKEKNQLKKFDFENSQVNQRNFEDYCIAHYEKILSHSESEKLFTFLELNPEKKTDFLLYGKTILKADAAVVFEAKPFLKKRSKGAIRTVILKWTAVAAGIVLIVSVFYKSPDKETVKLPQTIVAIESNKVEEKPSNSEGRVVNSNPSIKAKIALGAPTTVISPEQENGKHEFPKNENLALLQPIAASPLESPDNELHPELLLANTSTINSNTEVEEFEVLDYAEKVIREKVLKSPGDQPRRRFSLWDLADITLKGYNRISEKDIILHRKTDENGKLTVFAIETENNKYGFESKN